MSTPSDDDFDNDALQEGLGRTLAGVSPVPSVGLAGALLGPGSGDQECADIYRYPGADLSNPFGHIGFSLNGGPIYGKAPQAGYERRSLFETVPGRLEQVPASRKPEDHVQLCGVPRRIETAYRYWLDPKNSQDYYAPGDNCATLIPGGLRYAGLPTPAGNTVFPKGLMEALHPMYDSSGQMQFQGTRP